MRSFKDIDLKLCTRCGNCVSVCPYNVLEISNGKVNLVGECKSCGNCYQNCAGQEVSFIKMNERLFGTNNVDTEVGFHKEFYLGHAVDSEIRRRSSSGGVVTALLLSLFRSKKIEGAVVVGMDDNEPWKTKVKIATTEREILLSSQSKYTVVPLNAILKDIKDDVYRKIALVGLPCHIHGIRKLQLNSWEYSDKIKYCIGIFCGFNMTAQATEHLIRKMSVKKDEIKSLQYRGGSWPGGFLVETEGGKIKFLGKHVYSYTNALFVPERCLVCPDLTNELADISIGDAWDEDLDTKGWSRIIVRTEEGRDIFQDGLQDNLIYVRKSSKDDFLKSHAHLVKYKKKDFFIRYRLSNVKPHFEIIKSKITPKAAISGIVFYLELVIARKRIPRFIIGLLPFALLDFVTKRKTANFKKSSCGPFENPKKWKFKYRLRCIIENVIREYGYLTNKNWTIQEVGEFWDSVLDYDDINKESGSYFRRFTDSFKISDIKDNSYVLDFCCRSGNGTLFYGKMGKIKKAVCADVSELMLEICSKRLEKEGVNFVTKKIDSLDLSFDDEEFDAVLCLETIEHLAKPDILLKELGRITKKDGELILTTPNILWEPIHSLAAITGMHHSEGPHRFLRRRTIRRLILDSGFRIRKEITSVLIPFNNKFAIRTNDWFERKFANSLMPLIGLRRIFICLRN